MEEKKLINHPHLSTLHRRDFLNLIRTFNYLSFTVSEVKDTFSTFPKSIVALEKEENKIVDFVNGFYLFFKSFRLWKVLMKTPKAEYILKSAYYYLFFSYLNGKREVI